MRHGSEKSNTRVRLLISKNQPKFPTFTKSGQEPWLDANVSTRSKGRFVSVALVREIARLEERRKIQNEMQATEYDGVS